jgi:hypothetical protein
MKALVLLGLFFGACLWAQPGAQAPGLFPPPLSQYLGLTPSQVAKIVQINSSFVEAREAKAARLAELQPPMDPLAAPIPVAPEAVNAPADPKLQEISRLTDDLAALRRQAQQQIAAVLTAPQKEKLKVLEEALRLRNLGTMAECQNLLPGAPEGCLPSVPARRYRVSPPQQPPKPTK